MLSCYSVQIFESKSHIAIVLSNSLLLFNIMENFMYTLPQELNIRVLQNGIENSEFMTYTFLMFFHCLFKVRMGWSLILIGEFCSFSQLHLCPHSNFFSSSALIQKLMRNIWKWTLIVELNLFETSEICLVQTSCMSNLCHCINVTLLVYKVISRSKLKNISIHEVKLGFGCVYGILAKLIVNYSF